MQQSRLWLLALVVSVSQQRDKSTDPGQSCGFNVSTDCARIPDEQCKALCDFWQQTDGPSWCDGSSDYSSGHCGWGNASQSPICTRRRSRAPAAAITVRLTCSELHPLTRAQHRRRWAGVGDCYHNGISEL